MGKEEASEIGRVRPKKTSDMPETPDRSERHTLATAILKNATKMTKRCPVPEER